MKRLKYFAFLILMLATVAGCKKDLADVNFTISQSTTFTIQPNSILQLPDVLTGNINENWQGDFSSNNADVNKIDELKLNSLALTITSPDGKTWGFMQSIAIYIQAEGLPETKMAYIDNIPENAGRTINLTTTSADLRQYVQKNSFTLRIASSARSYNPDTINARADMVFGVKANPLK